MASMAPVPTEVPEKKYKYINSATSDLKVGEKDYGLVGDLLEDAIAWLSDKMLDILEPFINWGARLIIVACILIYTCTSERKYIASAIKWGIIFTVFWAIRSGI